MRISIPSSRSRALKMVSAHLPMLAQLNSVFKLFNLHVLLIRCSLLVVFHLSDVTLFSKTVFSRRILEENEPDYYSGKFFFLFFFVRPQNVCVVDTFYRTTKSRQAESYLSYCKGSPLSCTQFLT